MKFNLLSKALMFSGMLAMVACSNDEPATGNGDNLTPNEDGVAYMKVRISSADKMSRATTTPGYEYGDEKENDVKHVRFFFFDKDGASMDLTAYLVNQDDANTLVDRKPQPGEDGKYDNVEAVFAENLLVLENLKSNEYPSYMITILNDDDFRCGTNLNNTLELLDNYKKGDDDNYNYVMSTSSYYDGTNLNYHATPLKATDFKNTPQAAVADDAAVEVYVERLAAKVQLSITATASKTNVKYNGETFDIFELSESVSGGNNTDNDADGDVTVLDTKLYLRVIGWALNTTANHSYMCKNLPASDWVSGWKNPAWNIVGDHRSYWGKSYTYGDGAAAIESKVTYTPTKKLANDLIYKINDGVAYCNENTNEVANVFSKGEGTDRATVDSRVVTNVVLRTQIVDSEGAPVDMVLANGVLFRKNSYLQYILNRAYVSTGDGDNKLSALNVWEKNGDYTEGETTVKEYKQIGTEYFTLEFPDEENYQGLGDVDVVVNESAFAGKKFYRYNPTPAEGESAYTEITDMAPVIAEIKAKIAAVQPEGKNHAVIYDNGNNIYYIPVEHLGADKSQTSVIEGYYGVVRNHWYKLNITSFSKVGHGLWEPGTGNEVTKPDQPEDPLYYLGAHINILSWKIVNQDVEL